MNRINSKIAFTGIMFSLVILFQYLEKFMPFGDFGWVKFNFSIVFIFAVAFIAGIKYAFIVLILRFAIGPALGESGYTIAGLISHLILFIVGFLTIFIFYFLNIILNKTLFKSRDSWSKNRKDMTIYAINSIITTLLVALIMSTLNAMLFTRWFFAAYMGDSLPIPLNEFIGMYETGGLKIFYFGIPNYWAGQYAVYFTFNTINLIINFILFKPIQKVSSILNLK